MSQLKTKFIANNAVTNAKAAQMPTLTLKGNNTGGTANALDLTVSQVNTLLGTLSAALAQNHIFVGSAGGVATDVAMSGEASIVASGAITLDNAAVISKLLTAYSAAAGVVSAADTIIGAIQKLDGNIGTKQAAGNYITALTGEVSAAGPGSAAATISNAAVIAKVLTAYSAAAGTVSATDSILSAIQKIDGNNAAKLSTALASAHIFVGSAGGVATDVAMSGEASISNLGAVTLSNAAVIAKVLTGFVSGAGVLSASDSILAAIQKLDGNIKALPDPITYKGTYNATTNTPTLSNSDTGKNGYLYQVTVAGSVDFGAGAISFEIGDKVVNNGTVWDKWDMTDAVSSVNGQIGAVSLALNNLTNLNAPSPSNGQVLTYDTATSKWIAASTAATSTATEESFALSGTNITNQYIDLAHVALGASNSVNSVCLAVAGAGRQIKGTDFSVSLTGGAGGVTRITFLNDLATGGVSALDTADTLIVNYSF